MQQKKKSVFPNGPLKIYTITPAGINPQRVPDRSHFSRRTDLAFVSTLVIQATPDLPNDDDLCDARLCVSAKMVGQGVHEDWRLVRTCARAFSGWASAIIATAAASAIT